VLISSLKREIKTKKRDKILCIIEGKLELNLLSRFLCLLSNDESIDLKNRISLKQRQKECCNSMIKKYFVVHWGDKYLSKNCDDFGNKVGGHNNGLLAPKPAIRSFKQELSNIKNYYKYVIIIFDSDMDFDNEVEKFFKEELDKITNAYLIVSKPCFEKVIMECFCDKKNEWKLFTKCEEFKKKFSNISCFKVFESMFSKPRQVKAESLVEMIDNNHLNNLFCKNLKELKEILKGE